MKIKLLFIAVFLLNISIQAQCWRQISAGQNHSLAIKFDGTLWSWGWNTHGSLGTGNNINSNTPVQVGTENNWAKIAGGGAHSLAIKNDGTLWAWGYNMYGQIGNNTNIDVWSPTQIGTGNDWKDIFAGVYSSAAIKNNGTLWAWGENGSYQIQPTNDPNILVPMQIGNDMDWRTLSFGGTVTLALKNNNTLWSWGMSLTGDLGNGNLLSTQVTPAQVGTSADWKEISNGWWYSMAIKTNGTLWSWGEGYLSYPTQNGFSSDWNKISSDAGTNLGIKNNGTLWSWGNNSWGQFGNGTTVSSMIPAQVGTQSDWIDVSNGYKFSMALNSTNNLKTFGDNANGQLGNGTNNNSYTPNGVSCTSLGLIPVEVNDFSIYPNPSKDYFYIKSVVNLNVKSISVIDSSGKTVYTKSGYVSKINISDFPAGMYLVKIVTSEQVFTYKLIKN